MEKRPIEKYTNAHCSLQLDEQHENVYNSL